MSGGGVARVQVLIEVPVDGWSGSHTLDEVRERVGKEAVQKINNQPSSLRGRSIHNG